MPGFRTRGGIALVMAGLAAAAGCGWGPSRVVQAGFYFDDLTFASQALGGRLHAGHLGTIEAVARAELARAFHGLRVTFSARHDARYRVAVVQQVRDPRLHAEMYVAGESRAVTGVGGSGAVNFSLLASAALSCAPRGASVAELVAAIGRGVGRAAAHEFAHQFLPTAPLHESRDRQSYEYDAASRCEQYFGEMHWDVAGPLLRRRLGG